MNQLEKMNKIYSQIKETVIAKDISSEDAKGFVHSDVTDNLAKELELNFPFQYSSETEGMYFFATVETFKEYIIERLCNEDVITSDDYYESSEDEWQSSSC